MISALPALLLAGLLLSGVAPAQAAGRGLVGIAPTSGSCANHPTVFEGVNVSGNTWSFTFISVISVGGTCSFAEAGHVTGVWNPTSPTTQNCVTGTGVGRFCLASPTTSGSLGTDPSVPFSLCAVTCVNGNAQVTQVSV